MPLTTTIQGFFNQRTAVFKYLFFGGDVCWEEGIFLRQIVSAAENARSVPQGIEISEELKKVTKEMEHWWSKPLLCRKKGFETKRHV